MNDCSSISLSLYHKWISLCYSISILITFIYPYPINECWLYVQKQTNQAAILWFGFSFISFSSFSNTPIYYVINYFDIVFISSKNLASKQKTNKTTHNNICMVVVATPLYHKWQYQPCIDQQANQTKTK